MTLFRSVVLGIAFPMFVMLLVPDRAVAQNARDDALSAAIEEFDTDTRFDLLWGLSDPGPALDEVWVRSALYLAQELLDQNDQENASVLLRLAARHGPPVEVSNAVFTPTLVAAWEDVQGELLAGAPEPTAGSTTWLWPPEFDASQQGGLQVTSADPAVTIQVSVSGDDVLPGAVEPMAAGTYTVDISADGYQPLQITREVMPGTTTQVVAVLLPEGGGVVIPPPPPSGAEPAQEGGGLPSWVWVGGGAVAVGVAALVLGGGGGGNGGQSGLSITFPGG